MRGNERAAPLPQGGGTRTRASNAHSRGDSTPTGRRAQGPVHGRVVGTTWVKQVRRSKHLRRLPFAGWAFDILDLEAARDLGVTWIELCDKQSGQTWEAPLSLVLERGVEFDYGFGPQVCLALKWWITPLETGQQLALWEAVR